MSNAQSDFRKLTGKIEDFARDLTSLEVNTIVKENISGDKMPGNHHAIVDISHAFRLKLLEYGAIFDDQPIRNAMISKAVASEGNLSAAAVSYGFQSEDNFAQFASGELHGYGGFSLFRKHAVAMMTALQSEVPTIPSSRENRKKALMLSRIKDMCDQLKSLLTGPTFKYRFPFSRAQVVAMETGVNPDNLPALTPLEFNSQQMTMLRKIWEVQTETIVMQTIMHLDGDVLNRISPDYLEDNGASRMLFEMHNQGVKTSMTLWSELVDVVRSFFSAFVKA